jgi:hypothetical protein
MAKGVASQGREFFHYRAHFWFIKALLANMLYYSTSDGKQPNKNG